MAWRHFGIRCSGSLAFRLCVFLRFRGEGATTCDPKPAPLPLQTASMYACMYVCMHVYIYIYMVAPRRPTPRPQWYPVMYSCTSISNGRHGVFSPPPCGTGYPSASVFVLCFLRHPLPPPLRFCGFPTVRAGQEEGEPTPPPLWNRMVFPFAIHTHARTHTHTTPCLCECMAILSPTPSCGTGWFSLLL